MTSHLLLDTNILIYSRDEASAFYSVVSEALQGLVVADIDLCIHRQILREYVAVATRPRPRGLGVTLEQALVEVGEFEEFYRVLDDPDGIWERWKQCIQDAKITGIRVHDAYLAAVMRGHQVETILTMNAKDFENIDRIEVALPQNWRELVRVDEDGLSTPE